jgi:hypothetical protein
MDIDPSEIIKAVAAYKVGQGTVGRLLGPTIDLYAEELKEINERMLSRRRENVDRVFEKAAEKLGERINEPGSVHPRVFKEVFDDGSYAEDELIADYYGGVLASSRSGVSRDDRGAAFAKLVGRLSVYQIRTHFLCYKSLKTGINRGALTSRNNPLFTDFRRGAAVEVPLDEFVVGMDFGPDEGISVVEHALSGLEFEGLIYPLSYPLTIGLNGPLAFAPTTRGVELYLWAHGSGQLAVADFINPSIVLEWDESMPCMGAAARYHQHPETGV